MQESCPAHEGSFLPEFQKWWLWAELICSGKIVRKCAWPVCLRSELFIGKRKSYHLAAWELESLAWRLSQFSEILGFWWKIEILSWILSIPSLSISKRRINLVDLPTKNCRISIRNRLSQKVDERNRKGYWWVHPTNGMSEAGPPETNWGSVTKHRIKASELYRGEKVTCERDEPY